MGEAKAFLKRPPEYARCSTSHFRTLTRHPLQMSPLIDQGLLRIEGMQGLRHPSPAPCYYPVRGWHCGRRLTRVGRDGSAYRYTVLVRLNTKQAVPLLELAELGLDAYRYVTYMIGLDWTSQQQHADVGTPMRHTQLARRRGARVQGRVHHANR